MKSAFCALISSVKVGFSTGDAATLWGVSKSSFDLNWFDGQGAPGFTNAQRTGGGLTVLFGHDPGSDSDYTNRPNLGLSAVSNGGIL